MFFNLFKPCILLWLEAQWGFDDDDDEGGDEDEEEDDDNVKMKRFSFFIDFFVARKCS